MPKIAGRQGGRDPSNVSWYWDGDCKIITSHSTFPTGYASVYVDGKQVRIHRAVWAAHNGAIPRGQVIRHTCDNPSCFTLQHLEIGTQAQNIQDRVDRGRGARGESVTVGKLIEAEAWMIRYKHPDKTNVQLGVMYDVAASTISNIRHGKTWKHLRGEDYNG